MAAQIGFRFLSDFKDATGTFEKGSVFKETLKNAKWWSECSSWGGRSRVQCVDLHSSNESVGMSLSNVPEEQKNSQVSVLTSYHFIPYHCCATESAHLTVGNDFVEQGFTPENGATQAPAEALFCTCKPLHSSCDSREMQAPITISKHTVPVSRDHAVPLLLQQCKHLPREDKEIWSDTRRLSCMGFSQEAKFFSCQVEASEWCLLFLKE